MFAPVLGETGAQRKKISARSGSLVPSSPLGALSEVSKQDKRKWRGCKSATKSLFSPYLTSFPALPTNTDSSPLPKMPVDGEYFLLKVPSLGKEDRQSLARTLGLDNGIKDVNAALAGVAQWIECQPANQRVAGWIPHQGTCLGCTPGPQ